jgi:uncharacterized protein YndB with AHSA1/START domain
MKSEVKIEGDRVTITRVFQAPREVVFGWWSRPEKLAQWSGCKDARNCQVEMDFRVGGGFTQRMQIGDKGSFTFTGVYEEIVEPEKIVYHANLGPAVTRVRLELFDEPDGRTRMVLTQDGFPDAMLSNIVSQGTMESFEKLEAALADAAVAG